MTVNFKSQLAVAIEMHQIGKYSEALPLYEKLALDFPDNFEIMHFLGLIYFDLKNYEKSEETLKQSIQFNNSFAPAYFNLGRVYDKLKKYVLSLEYELMAIKLSPHFPAAYVIIGRAKDNLGDLAGALSAYDTALRQDPNFLEALSQKGHTLRHANRLDDALIWETKAANFAPHKADVFVNRGITLAKMRKFDIAIKNFSLAIKLDPTLALAHLELSKAYYELHRHVDAFESVNCALQLDRHLEGAVEHRIYLSGLLADWNSFESDKVQISEQLANPNNSSLCLPVLNFSNTRQLNWLAAKSQENSQTHFIDLDPISKRRSCERIHIGYFSSDFRQHPVAQLINGVLENHDKTKFEISAFSLGSPTNDYHYTRTMNAVEHFHQVKSRSTPDLINFARSKNLDIAVDLNGYTALSRPEIFYNRVAPAQVNFLGYPGSMAMESMDYIVADKIVIADEHVTDYSEKIIYMPHSYLPNERRSTQSPNLLSRATYGLPEDKFIYCGFNATQKITPDVFNVWMKVLKKQPNSVLWLRTSNPRTEENFRREAEARDVKADRLHFANKVAEDEHFARYGLADLFLDTWPYNAHTTATEALWAGLPVLTKIGETFPSRVAASVLAACNLEQFITRTEVQFIEVAVGISEQRKHLAAIKEKLLVNRHTLPLYDAALFARHLENAFTQIFEIQKGNEKPTHIRVQS
jgi:protein O-GlcNAc transferase